MPRAITAGAARRQTCRAGSQNFGENRTGAVRAEDHAPLDQGLTDLRDHIGLKPLVEVKAKED
jgi:hypothetical protein